MVDVSRTRKFTASKSGLAFIALLGMGLGFVLFGTVWGLFGPHIVAPLRKILVWTGVFIFSGGALRNIWRIVRRHKLTLVISPQGFHHSEVSLQPIPWKSVLEISRTSPSTNKSYITVKIPDETWRSGNISSFARWMRYINAAFGEDGLNLDVAYFPCRIEQMESIFNEYAAAYGGKVQS
jgi:hypothetical protein